MESDSRGRFLTNIYRRHQHLFVDGWGEEEVYKVEFDCPFCGDVFDIVELCFHIDHLHPLQAKNGVCSICAAKVGVDLGGHIAVQHGNFFKMQKKRISPHSSYQLSRKENIRKLFGSAHVVPPPPPLPDASLSSLICTLPAVTDNSMDEKQDSSNEVSMSRKTSDAERKERVEGCSMLSEEDQEELSSRSRFVQGLVYSSVFQW